MSLYPTAASGLTCAAESWFSVSTNGMERSDFQLISGGWCEFLADYEPLVAQAPWIVYVPDDLAHLKDEIVNVVNENVRYGCCGGCL